MINHWEEFQSGPTLPPDKRQHVTLNHKNVIHLNGNLHDRLGNPEAVRLLFDKVNSIIGIDAAPPSSPNAFPVTPKARTRSREIRATTFCRHYGIKVDRTTAFITADIDEDGILRLDLRSTSVVTKPGRRKHSR